MPPHPSAIFWHKNAKNAQRERVRKRKAKPKKIILKTTNSLNSIIESSPFSKNKINFLSIDIENHEYEALKNFKFNKYKIQCIVTELINSENKRKFYDQNSLSHNVRFNIILNKNYRTVRRRNIL